MVGFPGGKHNLVSLELLHRTVFEDTLYGSQFDFFKQKDVFQLT